MTNILFVCHGSILRSPEKACYINGLHRSNGAYYTTITPYFFDFLYSLGDIPTFSRKHFPKWLVCKNPTRFAISLIGASVLRSNSAALDRRYIDTARFVMTI